MFGSFSSLDITDFIGIVGIFISLLGFGTALYQLRKTKSAAESAKESAAKAIQGIQKLDSLLSFSAVSSALEAIKNACREENYNALPGLFDHARKSLIAARASRDDLDEETEVEIQKALSFLKSMELETVKGDKQGLRDQKIKFMKSLIEISDLISKILSESKADGEIR